MLKELDNDSFKFSKYQKILRDVNAKLSFINAEKDYLVRFLDNERMTTMNGPKVHKDMMEEACKNFDLDVIQIQNLYEILLKEITNKATKKIYKELYNNGYLKEIEAAEKSFEKQVSNINVTGTFINSNYWRLEGIKNIYEVFENQVTQNFDRDLSEFQEQEEIEETDIDDNQDIFVNENEDIFDNEEEQDDEEYYSEDNYDEEDDEEYDIEDDEYDIDDDDDYQEDDYEDEYDEEDEDEYYYDDDEENETYDDEYDEEDDYSEEDYDDEEDEYLEEDFDAEKTMNKKYSEDSKGRVNPKNRQNVNKTNSKKKAEKNDKPGIFRNFLGKMKNENKS